MLTATVLGAAVLSGCSSKGKNAAEKKTVTLTIFGDVLCHIRKTGGRGNGHPAPLFFRLNLPDLQKF